MKKLLLTAAAFAAMFTHAQNAAMAPRFLADPAKPAEFEKQITAQGANVTVKAEAGKIVFAFTQGDNQWPGAAIKPLDGNAWNLAPFGRVEARVTNTSDKQLGIGMRLDNPGDGQPWNYEVLWLQPNESRVHKVIFGHQNGFNPAPHKLDPANIVRILFYLEGKADRALTFTVEDLMAIGAAGEKPPLNPTTHLTRIPANANLLAAGYEVATQSTGNNATVASADGRFNATFRNNANIVFKPELGGWDLRDGNALAITLKNTGAAPANPKLQARSRNNERTDLATLDAPLAPGATATLVASFIPKIPWQVGTAEDGKAIPMFPGTGTKFASDKTAEIQLFADDGASLEIASLTLLIERGPIPEWLGKHPPVPAAEWPRWKQTLDENFDAPLDLKKWNIYTDNYWDKRTHFTKDNLIVKDGKLILRYEKKRGRANDVEDTITDYACGYADTYGKWTQRYGYIEVRLKIPEADGLWPCFWTMPDRGAKAAGGEEQWRRSDTANGGMELDIMENLSGWGPHRFNQAFHWDGYGPGHKAVGSSWAYVRPADDGFITIGILWLPGLAIYYSNGQELGRMESDRVCSVQSYPIICMISGGWDNTPLNDAQLPVDYVIDYVRAWQRDDLATPGDGFKENDGRPKMHTHRADGFPYPPEFVYPADYPNPPKR